MVAFVHSTSVNVKYAVVPSSPDVNPVKVLPPIEYHAPDTSLVVLYAVVAASSVAASVKSAIL